MLNTWEDIPRTEDGSPPSRVYMVSNESVMHNITVTEQLLSFLVSIKQDSVEQQEDTGAPQHSNPAEPEQLETIPLKHALDEQPEKI